MKKRLLTIVPFLLGLFLCGYPLISSLVERQHQQNAVATYKGMINKESHVKVFPKHTPITEECIQETKKQSSVKTGDSLDVWIWLTGMVIAIGITGVVLRIKNKKE